MTALVAWLIVAIYIVMLAKLRERWIIALLVFAVGLAILATVGVI